MRYKLVCLVGGALLLGGCNSENSPQKLVTPASGEEADKDLVLQASREFKSLNEQMALGKVAASSKENKLTTCDKGNKKADYFDFALLNDQLRQLPTFKKILKKDVIATCDEAREFIKRKYEVIESPASEDASSYMPEPVALEKTSIRRGTPENSAGKVELEFNTNLCTGALISPRVVLTSAHCLAPSIAPLKDARGNLWAVNYFDPSVPSPTKYLIGAGTMHFIMCPTWPGGNDAESDIALIISDEPFRGVYHGYLRFYMGTMSNGRRDYIWGRGYNAYAGTGSGVLRKGLEYVDWYGSYHIIATESGSIQTCLGDSGGPWIRDDATDDLMTGIHSGSDESVSNTCTKGGGKMRACRVSAKFAWISAQLAANGIPACTQSGDFGQCF